MALLPGRKKKRGRRSAGKAGPAGTLDWVLRVMERPAEAHPNLEACAARNRPPSQKSKTCRHCGATVPESLWKSKCLVTCFDIVYY